MANRAGVAHHRGRSRRQQPSDRGVSEGVRGASACRLGGFIFCVRIRKTVIVARAAFPTALGSPPARGFFLSSVCQ
jgi:hypothetical protein